MIRYWHQYFTNYHTLLKNYKSHGAVNEGLINTQKLKAEIKKVEHLIAVLSNAIKINASLYEASFALDIVQNMGKTTLQSKTTW